MDYHQTGAPADIQPAHPDNFICLCPAGFGGMQCELPLTTPTTTQTTTGTTTQTTTPIEALFTCTAEGYLSLSTTDRCVPQNRLLQQVVDACHVSSGPTVCSTINGIAGNLIFGGQTCNATAIGVNAAISSYTITEQGTAFCTPGGFVKWQDAGTCLNQVGSLNLAMLAFQDNTFKDCDATTVTTTPTTSQTTSATTTQTSSQTTTSTTTPTTSQTTTAHNAKFECFERNGVSYLTVPSSESCDLSVGSLNGLINACAAAAPTVSAFNGHTSRANNDNFFTCNTSLVESQTLLHVRSRENCLVGVSELDEVFRTWGFEPSPTFLRLGCSAGGFVEAVSDCQATAARLNEVIDGHLTGEFSGCRLSTVTTTPTTTVTTTATTFGPTAAPTDAPTVPVLLASSAIEPVWPSGRGSETVNIATGMVILSVFLGLIVAVIASHCAPGARDKDDDDDWEEASNVGARSKFAASNKIAAADREMSIASRSGRPTSRTSRDSNGSVRGVRPARRSSQFQEALNKFALVQPAAAALLQKARQRRDSQEDSPQRRASGLNNNAAQAVHRMSTSNPFTDAPVADRGNDPFPGGTPPTGMRSSSDVVPPPGLRRNPSFSGATPPPTGLPPMQRPGGTPRLPPRPSGFSNQAPGTLPPRPSGIMMPPRPTLAMQGRPTLPSQSNRPPMLPPQRPAIPGGLPPPRLAGAGGSGSLPPMRQPGMPPRPTGLPPRPQ